MHRNQGNITVDPVFVKLLKLQCNQSGLQVKGTTLSMHSTSLFCCGASRLCIISL
jgi:hypothetical protein